MKKHPPASSLDQQHQQQPQSKKHRSDHQQHPTNHGRKEEGVSKDANGNLKKEQDLLPVAPFRERLVRAMTGPQAQHRALLVVGATGSGKSTQIPAFLLQHLQKESHHDHNQHPSSFHTSHRRNMLLAVTQPRRVAAMSLARRVADEQGTALGRGTVGYRVRFEAACSRDTRLVYVTAGMLLRESMVDPSLSRYHTIFIDEAHERSLQTDILLGVVQRARRLRREQPQQPQASNPFQQRPDPGPLKMVIMSATLNVDTFVEFLQRTAVENKEPTKSKSGEKSSVATTTVSSVVDTIEIPGRQFPVQVLYTQRPVTDYLEAAVVTILQIHQHDPRQPGKDAGDILVFLPGQEEIEDVAALLRQHLEDEAGDVVTDLRTKKHGHNGPAQVINDVLICPFYAALSADAQMAAFQPRPKGATYRKVILSTTLAETSVTLPDIRFVVDSGKHRCRNVVNTAAGKHRSSSAMSLSLMESLTEENISQAQAIQRTGRAGRIAAGMCFRLYTEDAFANLSAETVPEIRRVSLAEVVLQLKSMGIADPTQFDFVTPPERSMLQRAVKLLYALEALDDKMELTDKGRQLAKLPLEPVLGHMLCASAVYGCTSQMLTIVSVLSSTESLLVRPSAGNSHEGGSVSSRRAAAHKRFASHEGDLPTSLNVYTAWEKEAIFVPPTRGGLKAQKKLQRHAGGKKLLHGEWCQQNYVSGRALARSFHVRGQLHALCVRPESQNGLGMDVSSTADAETFLKCCAAGLFLQAASRVKVEAEVDTGRGRSGLVLSNATSRGRYRTKLGSELVAIHPTSTLFQRQPAPACVVYTELVTTTKTYIRGVTQIREEWLQEVAPNFYK